MLDSYDQVVQEYTFLFSKEVALMTTVSTNPHFIEICGNSECKHQFKHSEFRCRLSNGDLKYLITFDLCVFCLKGFVEFLPNRTVVRLVVS